MQESCNCRNLQKKIVHDNLEQDQPWIVSMCVMFRMWGAYLNEKHICVHNLLQLQCHNSFCQFQIVCDRGQEAKPGMGKYCRPPM